MSGFSGEVNLLGSAPGTVLHMFPQNMSHNETFQGLVEASWNGMQMCFYLRLALVNTVVRFIAGCTLLKIKVL